MHMAGDDDDGVCVRVCVADYTVVHRSYVVERMLVHANVMMCRFSTLTLCSLFRFSSVCVCVSRVECLCLAFRTDACAVRVMKTTQ